MYKTKLQTNGKLDLYSGDKFLGTYDRREIGRVKGLHRRHEARARLEDLRIKRLERGLI